MKFAGFLAGLLFCGAALAQSDAVVVKAVRDPVKKSYGKMLDGAALFEQRHELAPAAALRFKLVPRKPDARLEGVELEVAADSLAIPLKVAPDQTFTLERNPVALRENARVMPNRRAGTMTWRADVRTPGLPPDVRRLGDLRLECEVGMKAGLISQYPRGLFGGIFPENETYCHRAAPRYLFFAERPLFGVTLVDGARREALSVNMLYGGAARNTDWKKDRHTDGEALLDRTYFVPLGDESWSDDTLVELEYMDGNAGALLTKSNFHDALGEAVVMDFANGYEVWVYPELLDEKAKIRRAELVLLFTPSGTLSKTRVR